MSYTWIDKATADDGMAFGVAHSDYTAAEIEECLESFASMDRGDKIAQEHSRRLVRQIGTFSGSGGGSAASFNSGMPVKTKLNWYIGSGDQVQIWIRNGSGTVYTTGSAITINGDVWLKDSV